ncbi:MAG: signal recognition particle-docking protein FtsY [Fusobacterium sp.]|nr:signal recognition particle-docking protein FtsY [Fusobacterium sp.]
MEDVKEDKVEELKEETPKEESKGFFSSLKEKLFKSREGLFGKLKSFILGRNVIDYEMYEELEDILIQSDIGMDMTVKIVGELEKEVKRRGIKDPKEIYPVLKEVMEGFLIKEGNEIKLEDGKLNVILVVGVNGVGKTTTIGKLASKYIKEGKKVILGAGDTFRAAAIEQLEEWANRSGAEIVKSTQGSDPGAVVFDTLSAAEARGADIAIIDTAGRLHNKNNLMKELEKIHNIIKKRLGERHYESILVIDGTTGQNGLSQAKVFNEVTDLTGFIITKLDGTAKGGIVFSISEEIKKPIKFIGVGEKIEDLRKFDAKEYIQAIFD